MELDFTGLNTIALREAQRDFKEEPEAPKMAVNEPTEASTEPQKQVDGLALISLKREQEDHKRLTEAYREYQNNIRRSGSLRSEILKGLLEKSVNTDRARAELRQAI